jgi:DNA-binding transcriptional LysR family regulator
MHLKTLKVFCDVVGQRSFSQAADANGMTQSGASHMIHQLEDHLGVRLLDRSKRPFILTQEGQTYYDGCRQIVKRYDALEESVRTLHDEVAGRVAIASIYSVGLSHMSEFVQQFMGQYPKADVRLQYQHPDKVYDLVQNDLVDFGLVSYPRASRTIKSLTWRDEPMVFVCSPAHRLADRQQIAIADLAGEAFVSFDCGLQIRHEIDKTLASRQVQVDVVMEFDNIETLKRAVEIDAGVTLLPLPTVARELAVGSLVTARLSDVELVRPLGIIHRRGAELGITTQRFKQMLRGTRDADVPPDSGSTEPNGRSSQRDKWEQEKQTT